MFKLLCTIAIDHLDGIVILNKFSVFSMNFSSSSQKSIYLLGSLDIFFHILVISTIDKLVLSSANMYAHTANDPNMLLHISAGKIKLFFSIFFATLLTVLLIYYSPLLISIFLHSQEIFYSI